MTLPSAWTDATSYSQGEREKKIAPRTYEMRAGKMRIITTRHIHYDPTDWILRMEGVFETVLKGDKTADFAKQNCLMLARDYLRNAMDAVTKELEVGTFKAVDAALADKKATKKSE